MTAAVEDDAERVGLELVAAVLTPDPSGKRVPDEPDARASGALRHQGAATLTVAIGQVRFFIPAALIAKPFPGRECVGVNNAHKARGETRDPCRTPSTNAQS